MTVNFLDSDLRISEWELTEHLQPATSRLTTTTTSLEPHARRGEALRQLFRRRHYHDGQQCWQSRPERRSRVHRSSSRRISTPRWCQAVTPGIRPYARCHLLPTAPNYSPLPMSLSSAEFLKWQDDLHFCGTS